MRVIMARSIEQIVTLLGILSVLICLYGGYKAISSFDSIPHREQLLREQAFKLASVRNQLERQNRTLNRFSSQMNQLRDKNQNLTQQILKMSNVKNKRVREIPEMLRTELRSKPSKTDSGSMYNLFETISVSHEQLHTRYREEAFRNQKDKHDRGIFEKRIPLSNKSLELMQNVKDEIFSHQFPEDCKSTKQLKCPWTGFCGFGCAFHQLAWCFTVGHILQRNVVIEGHTSHIPDGWESLFHPITNCPRKSGNQRLTADTLDLEVVSLPYYSRGWENEFAKWAFYYYPPEWDKQETRMIHSYPPLWFQGIVEGHLLRINENTTREFERRRGLLSSEWKHPIACIHVRRSDHIIEAPYRKIEEYMAIVEKWFEASNIQKGNETRRVFIATEDEKVLSELEVWTNITWVHTSRSEFIVNRQSQEGTLSVLFDIFQLSQCDFVVGTHSSQVTRLSYELMQTNRNNGYSFLYSLDDPWYHP
eukprot:TRINITY_DN7322_c0_g1_i1.p1 TRINITY_DN7322_c0_g1~~TRINITY_DN7322_c0_g1_i1.p1  ORF type:complete len:477 (+),score=57.54 TRINITY_DN7322_c0_g1_i1:21-1451(+)